MSNLTLEDIAKQAGVSRSTVSRVVNDQPNVRENVRKRVWEVIKRTGYHPNAAARTLASQRSWMIGLVLPRSVSSLFTDPYFVHLTQGIAQACNQLNYTLSLFLIGSEEDEEKIFPRISRRGMLDGILVLSDQVGDELIGRLVHSNIPFMIVGRPFQTHQTNGDDGVSYIDVDNVNASYLAVLHLVELGYERIGTITGPAINTVGRDRKEGYVTALVEHGFKVDDSLIAEGDFTEAGGYHAMQSLLPANPDAVFAASDLMAMGAMRAVLDAGLRVPEDVAFVGFDDVPIPGPSICSLTTIHQPVFEMGTKSVENLIDLIENGIRPARRVIMETELVVRDSCGALQRVRNG